MKSLRMAALALALGASGAAMAATDGLVGTTSTGTVTVNLTVSPPIGAQVQIFGLDDITLPSFTRVAGQVSVIGSADDYFCLVNHNDIGNPRVFVKLSQDGVVAGDVFRLNGAGGKSATISSIAFVAPSGFSDAGYLASGDEFGLLPSAAGCSVTSTVGVANRILINFADLPANSNLADGALSGTFTLLVTPIG